MAELGRTSIDIKSVNYLAIKLLVPYRLRSIGIQRPAARFALRKDVKMKRLYFVCGCEVGCRLGLHNTVYQKKKKKHLLCFWFLAARYTFLILLYCAILIPNQNNAQEHHSS